MRTSLDGHPWSESIEIGRQLVLPNPFDEIAVIENSFGWEECIEFRRGDAIAANDYYAPAQNLHQINFTCLETPQACSPTAQ